MTDLAIAMAAGGLGAFLGAAGAVGLLRPGRVARARRDLFERNPELYARLCMTPEQSLNIERAKWAARRADEDRWALQHGGTDVLRQVREMESQHATEHGYPDPNLGP